MLIWVFFEHMLNLEFVDRRALKFQLAKSTRMIPNAKCLDVCVKQAGKEPFQFVLLLFGLDFKTYVLNAKSVFCQQFVHDHRLFGLFRSQTVEHRTNARLNFFHAHESIYFRSQGKPGLAIRFL